MISLIFSGFREKKKYIISLILFIFGYLILLIIFSIHNHYRYNIDLLKNEPINRGIEIFINDLSAIDSFKNDIEYYYPIFANQEIKINNQYYYFNSWNSDDTLIVGQTIKNTNEIIISKRLFNILKLNENDYNKILEYTVNNNEYTFNIVGVSSNNQSDIYMSYKDFITIFDLEPDRYYILIDNYDKVSKFIESMTEIGILANLYDSTIQSQIDSMVNLKNIYEYIMCFIVLLIFIFLLVIVKNSIQYENKNIAIFKAMGYRINNILYIILMRLIIVSLLSYIVIQLLIFLIFIISSNIFIQYGLSLFNLLKYNTITMVLICVLILINVFFYKKKIFKMNVIEILQDF